MGQDSKIQWCHHTFNPWRGCTKVSAGCTNCYAETLSKRNPAVLGVWGDLGTRVVASESMWRQPLRWNDEARKSGERRRVFTASLADVFEDRPELVAPRNRLFGLIVATPSLDWLVLTKRPETAVRYYQRKHMWLAAEAYRDLVYGPESEVSLGDGLAHWPPHNVWQGVSVEDQATADERIPHLLKIPAAVRFVSYEPALGPVTFFDRDEGVLRGPAVVVSGGMTASTPDEPPEGYDDSYSGIDWLIAGGESGSHARPCYLAWLRSARDQCAAAGVPFFMKQWGSNRRFSEAEIWAGEAGRIVRDPKGGNPEEWPDDLQVRQFPEPAHAAR